MCDTEGCNEFHGTMELAYRVGAAMAVDQGETISRWDWPYHTTIAYQP